MSTSAGLNAVGENEPADLLGDLGPLRTGKPDSLVALKSKTKPYHDALEQELAPLVGGISIGPYTSLLKRLLGFYVPLEQQILAVSGLVSVLTDIERRRKTHLLVEDLLSLGMTKVDLARLPLCKDIPPVATVEEALGCLYVLEGATLGGQIITRHLKKNLGLEEGGGYAFFYSYGEDVGPMWKSFRAALRSRCSNGETEAVLIESARSTFVSLHRWLARIDESEVST